jgi:hypothetical protein
MQALSKLGLVVLLLTGCSAAPSASTDPMTAMCAGTFADVIRCKALLSFPADLRAYLVDIPVSQASNLPRAIAAYYPLDGRIEISPKLSDWGEAWAILTMRHEFVHALSWKMPGYREDARSMFAGLRAAIRVAEDERHAFTKYDQWLRAHAEYVDDLPHFITGIVELMAPGEMPASLDRYFAPLLRGMRVGVSRPGR